MPSDSDSVNALVSLIDRCRRLVVLTGAGCSTESGIPDYRDRDGEWKHRRPMQFQDFVSSHAMRQRYWAGSLVGWQRIYNASPNRAHIALAQLEHAGRVDTIITQNVDGLHQLAGSREVIDLHGRLSRVVCLDCGDRRSRQSVQRALLRANPAWRSLQAEEAPDGDARVAAGVGGFRVPACRRCGGVLKPDVVFFGESVPKDRVARAMASVQAADALLVAGSSLMVWSGLRFVRKAAERGIPVALVNLGRTRADELFTHRVARRCGETLGRIAARYPVQPTIR